MEELSVLQKAKKSVIIRMKKEKCAQSRIMLEKRKLLIEEYILDELKMKKKISVDKIVEDIKKDGGVDSETFWKVRSRIIGRKEVPRYAIRDKNGCLKENPEEAKLVYQTFYDDLLNGRLKEIPHNPEREEHVNTMIKGLELLNSITPDPVLEMEEVEKVRRSLKNNKASDKKGWKNEYLKSKSPEMGKSLHKIFSAVTEKQSPPKEWECVKIKSVPKKPPHVEMKTKRGLFLTSNVGKTYERVIKLRNEENIWNGMSEMQTGGKKKRGPIDNVMILLSKAERNKYLGADTYVTFTDIEKCFDNIWLEDSIVDIWRSGMSVRDAIMVKKLNEKARATVVTPYGETGEFELNSTVKQGGVSSVALCCSSLDRVNPIGRKIVTMFGPNIEIGAQAFVDDVESAGSLKVANDTVYNCKLLEDEKKLTVNTDIGKSAQMVIKGSKKNATETITEEVRRGKISRVDKYVYLGTTIDETATYKINIKDIKGKVQAMINTTKQVGSFHEVGKMATQTRLKLLESAIVKSILYNVEAFPTTTDEEIKELERVQHNVLNQLFEVPDSTPYAGLLMEGGLWLMESRVHYRKIMLYHNIMHSDDRRTIKSIILFQKEFERRSGTWFSDVQRMIKIYGITAEVNNVLKSAWKKEVKQRITEVNKQKVIKRCEEGVKTRFISTNEWGRKSYMNNATVEEVKRILKTRLCMVALPCNRRQREAEPGCSLCGNKDKIRMEHYLECHKLIHLRRVMKVERSTEEYVNGTIDCMLKVTRYLEKVSRLVVV